MNFCLKNILFVTKCSTPCNVTLLQKIFLLHTAMHQNSSLICNYETAFGNSNFKISDGFHGGGLYVRQINWSLWKFQPLNFQWILIDIDMIISIRKVSITILLIISTNKVINSLMMIISRGACVGLISRNRSEF
jgi:hypothetical protein